MGAIGGGIWHGIKGARNSPRVSAHCSERYLIAVFRSGFGEVYGCGRGEAKVLGSRSLAK